MKHVNKAGMSTEAIEQMWTGIAGAPKIEQPKITGSTKHVGQPHPHTNKYPSITNYTQPSHI
jgi:hypothetical protein